MTNQDRHHHSIDGLIGVRGMYIFETLMNNIKMPCIINCLSLLSCQSFNKYKFLSCFMFQIKDLPDWNIFDNSKVLKLIENYKFFNKNNYYLKEIEV